MSGGAHTNLPAPMSQSTPGSNPKRTIGIDQKRTDEIVGQAVGKSESVDVAPTNAVESVGGTNPQIAVFRRGQRQNYVA